jgi:enoyl-CoA hydratase
MSFSILETTFSGPYPGTENKDGSGLLFFREGVKTRSDLDQGEEDMSRGPAYLDLNNHVATITLDNPPLNVVTLGLTAALADCLDAALRNDDVAAVVLSGAGEKAFCAGSDITEFKDMMAPGQVVPKKLARQHEVFGRLDDFPKPTVAALHGAVYGGGLEIAACCDLLVAEEGTRFCLPEIKLGLFPSSGGPVRVTRRIGEGRAKEMMFLGEPIGVEMALAWGLINRIVAPGEALRTAQDLAAVIATRPPLALRLCKQAIDLALDASEDEAIRRALPLSDQAFSSDECREGVRAFLAKEKPHFRRC